jgi:hypothetical protein
MSTNFTKRSSQQVPYPNGYHAHRGDLDLWQIVVNLTFDFLVDLAGRAQQDACMCEVWKDFCVTSRFLQTDQKQYALLIQGNRLT